MEMDEVKSRLIEGIKLAQSAIKLDTADGNMQKSSHLYISAIQCFQEVLPNLTEDNQVLLQNKVRKTQQKENQGFITKHPISEQNLFSQSLIQFVIADCIIRKASFLTSRVFQVKFTKKPKQ